MTDTLRALLTTRQPWHSLPAAFYTDEAIFRAELDHIFARHWIFVGQEPDVPQPGDVMALQLGTAPILIVRGTDGEVRAFHNVCRHRGAQLVPEGRSRVPNLVCRYHTWTYATDGRLLLANHMGEGFDLSCRGLHPVALRSVAGLLFACLADESPADIDELARTMEPYLRPHRIAESKIARQVDLVERGNWKLTMENNRECYHCSGNHPELTAALFAYGFGFAPTALDETQRDEAAQYNVAVECSHAAWEAAGLPSRRVERLTGRATGYRAERLPLDRAGESHTLDTRAACRRPLGAVADARLGALSFWTQPNSWHHFMGDHAVTFSALPLAPDRTLLRTTWLVHKDAVEGVDYDLANLTAVWEATNRQDAALVEMTQAGVRSPAYQPGPYSPHTEGLVEQFCQWYVERMLGEAAPAQALPVQAAEAAPKRVARAAVASGESFSLTFARSGATVECPPGRTVLMAARKAGLRLPFSCAKGVCGTCKSRILSGQVSMQHDGGIRQDEIDDGLALLCCARPISDLVIDR